jgi:Putative beta-lactamase-inhibitor-like, PepSY-like
MKSLLIALLFGGSVYLVSCSNNSSTSTEETKDTTTKATSTSSTMQPSSENDTYANVPQPARTHFETKYPQATNVKWTHYEPNEMAPDEWTSDWMSNLDTSDYQVNFNYDSMDYTAWYDNGEWIGSTARMADNSKLPKAVNDAIHQKYPDYTIKEVDKENDKNQTVYEVDMENGKDKMKVHFDENGNAVKTKGKVGGQKIKEKEKTK